jgi:hypothetical protein
MGLIKTAATTAQVMLTAAFGSKSNYADYDYIIKWINIRNRDLNNCFQALGLNFDTQVVVLIGVPANTVNLATYQADGGLLANLVIPDSTDGSSAIEWRVTGQDDESWQPVPMVGKVIDTNTSTIPGTVTSDTGIVESYEWRGGTVWISPCNQIVDLRVRGDFLPSFSGDDAASYVKGAINVLAYWTCESISKYGPGDESAPIHTAFLSDFENAKDDFACMLAKAQMSAPLQLGGRRTQWPGGNSGGGFTLPIVG